MVETEESTLSQKISTILTGILLWMFIIALASSWSTLFVVKTLELMDII